VIETKEAKTSSQRCFSFVQLVFFNKIKLKGSFGQEQGWRLDNLRQKARLSCRGEPNPVKFR